jgi:hypothetical protein
MESLIVWTLGHSTCQCNRSELFGNRMENGIVWPHLYRYLTNTKYLGMGNLEIWIRAGFNPVNGKNGNIFLYILNPDIICQQWHYSHSPISSSGCGLRSMKSEKTKGPKLHVCTIKISVLLNCVLQIFLLGLLTLI